MIRRILVQQLGNPRGPFGRWLLRKVYDRTNHMMLRRTVDRLELGPDHQVLDIGFGGGQALEWMADKLEGGCAYGVDRSPDAVVVAERRFADQIAEGRIKVLCGDVHTLPWEDETFERACTVNTVYFWPDLATIFAEVCRVLVPGGMFIVCFSSPETMRASWWTQKDMLAPSAAEVEGAMVEAGLDVVDTIVEDVHDRYDTVMVVGVRGERARP